MSTIADYQNLIIADAPILYWPLTDGGTTADDYSGNGRDGTLGTNGTWAISNQRRGVWCFYISGTSSTALQYSGTLDTLNATGFSIEFWAYSNSTITTTVYPMVQGLGGWNEFRYTGTTATGVRFGTNSSSYLSSTLTANAFYHFVFTQTAAGSSLLYKNNAVAAGPTSLTVATSDMTGLSLESVGGWSGYYQHLAVYDYVLTPTQVSNRYTMSMDISAKIINNTIVGVPRKPRLSAVTRFAYRQPEHQIWPLGVYVPRDIDGNDLTGELDAED